ncbi:MAG TPA: PEP-CTERM sorting domain-containing protein [Spongiibacteraceae bacterium]|nr:PEP-CTERM sorting domain-containing protein [Spongiibacteraceae bacterium]
MMERKRSHTFFLLGVLSVVAVMSSPVFAAAASKCSGNGVANGAALEHKVQNGVCDEVPGDTPVPEPSGLAMLAGGLIAVYLRQVQKSKKTQ